MRAAETVLKTRLLVHFEVLNYEYPLEEDVPPHPFPGALLSAIDLIEEIERNLERDSTNGPVGATWERRRHQRDWNSAPKIEIPVSGRCFERWV